MATRLELQTFLEILLGSREVYFQPPPTVQMKYPAIVYKRDDELTEHANNKPYKTHNRYQLTVIDRNPDSTIKERVSALPLCEFDRFFVSDNLNHDVYKLFF